MREKKNVSLRVAYPIYHDQLCLVFCIACVESGLTLVAVGASEALLALAAELAPGLAPAAAVRSTHI